MRDGVCYPPCQELSRVRIKKIRNRSFELVLNGCLNALVEYG